jgi:hypothetical protein
MKVLILALTAISVLAGVLVTQPVELREQFANLYPNSEVPSSLGNFGDPPYGRTMLGQLYSTVFNEDLACDPLDSIVFSADSSNSPIVLIERGDCPFVMKVKHAEDIGAKAVLVIDDKDENVEKVVMGDNGTGSMITIPAFLISKSDGQRLKDYMEVDGSEHVMLKLDFSIETHKVVDYKIYFSSNTVETIQFLADFAPVAKSFKKSEATFTPGYVIYVCSSCA